MIKNLFITAAAICFTFGSSYAYASSCETKRTPQFSNDQVEVWESTICPGSKQMLEFHRHEHDRVIVALDDGTLKITNDKEGTHYLKFKKGQAYYLDKDPEGELHRDENTGNHSIKLLVIELKEKDGHRLLRKD